MTHLLLCKALYALYSPFQFIKLRIKGVKVNDIIYTGGKLFISKAPKSEISFGSKCRFMSKSWGNKLGLNHICMISTEPGASINIGNYCAFSGVSIWSFNSITIKDNVRVGANSLIIDGDAHPDDPRSGEPKPILIESNVWIGANVIVKKGVTIGRNSVIGINSIVTKDIPANCVAIGNPCTVVKYYDETMIKRIEEYFK